MSLPFARSKSNKDETQATITETVSTMEPLVSRAEQDCESVQETYSNYNEHDRDEGSLSQPWTTPHCSAPRKFWKQSGWRGGVAANIISVSLILLINIAILIWASQKRYRNGDVVARYSCDKSGHWITIFHLAVNILGSIILASSNYAMQVLSAPTRKEIDRAHKQKRWLFIAGQSFRNFRFISYKRLCLWLLLALSSLPFHLVYNSVIFQTTEANSYFSVIASPSFLSGAHYDITKVYDTTNTADFGKSSTPTSVNASLASIVQTLLEKSDAGSLQNLSANDCSRSHSLDVQNTHRNVVLVTKTIDTNNSLYGFMYSSPTIIKKSAWWCQTNNSAPGSPFRCNIGDTRVDVSYCLAETRSSESCVLEFNFELMGLIIISNVLKLICMSLLLWKYRTPTLVTIGDAVASFLEQPDAETRGYALATIHFDGGTLSGEKPSNNEPRVAKNRIEERNEYSELPYREVEEQRDSLQLLAKTANPGTDDNWLANPQGRYYNPKSWPTTWVSTVSRLAWTLFCLFYIFILFIMALFLAFSIMHLQEQGIEVSLPAIAAMGFGKLQLNSVVASSLPSRVSLLLIISNLPQLGLSFGYLLFNHVITAMLTSREWSLFAHQKKGLRVTHPSQHQRSTYWLQIPLRFALPNILFFGILHYLMSQTIFLVSLDVLSASEESPNTEKFLTLGFSTIAQIPAIILIFTILLVAILLGRIRNKPGIPPAYNCSAIISAACHPPPWNVKAALKKVQWGDVGPYMANVSCVMQAGEPGLGTDESEGPRHCCFSSGDVTPPMEGLQYL